MKNTSEYATWGNMKARCINERSKDYYLYGARGITVCDRWLNSFEDFILDMGMKPSEKHSIDRINVNGNYEPENCRWATVEEQANNRRNNHWILFNGQTKTITQWAKHLNISQASLYERLTKWTLHDALTIKNMKEN